MVSAEDATPNLSQWHHNHNHRNSHHHSQSLFNITKSHLDINRITYVFLNWWISRYFMNSCSCTLSELRKYIIEVLCSYCNTFCIILRQYTLWGYSTQNHSIRAGSCCHVIKPVKWFCLNYRRLNGLLSHLPTTSHYGVITTLTTSRWPPSVLAVGLHCDTINMQLLLGHASLELTLRPRSCWNKQHLVINC
jgi:hypothetical protein